MANEVGSKADTGKVDLTYVMEYFPNAIEAIARVSEFGDVKYTKITGRSARGSWLTVPNGIKRYTAALFRHLFCVLKGEEYDHEPEEYGLKPVLHRAQSAWNDLAILERWIREQRAQQGITQVELDSEKDNPDDYTGGAERSGMRLDSIYGVSLDRSIP